MGKTPVGVGVPDGHARMVNPACFAEAAGPERAEVEGDPVLPSDGVAYVGRCARHCRAGHESVVGDCAGVCPRPASWSGQLDHPGLIRVQEGPGPGLAERPADHVAGIVDAHGDARRVTRKGAQVFDLVGGGVDWKAGCIPSARAATGSPLIAARTRPTSVVRSKPLRIGVLLIGWLERDVARKLGPRDVEPPPPRVLCSP